MRRLTGSFSASLASVLTAAALLLFSACGKKEDTRTAAEKGRTIYSLHCLTCHNANPAKDGSLGPALQGSSLELLTARVIRGEYPPGYTPKRPTHIMQKLPLTEEEIQALHAYLNSL